MKIAQFFKSKKNDGSFEDIYYSTESNLVFMSNDKTKTLSKKIEESDTNFSTFQTNVNTTFSNLNSDGLIIKKENIEKAVISYDPTFNNNTGAIKFSFK